MPHSELGNLRRARIRCHQKLKQTEALLAGYQAKLASLEAAIYAIAPELVKSELKKADVGYAELSRRLTAMGLPETEGSVTVKINRGAFPAWFLFAVMRAIGAHTLRLEDWV